MISQQYPKNIVNCSVSEQDTIRIFLKRQHSAMSFRPRKSFNEQNQKAGEVSKRRIRLCLWRLFGTLLNIPSVTLRITNACPRTALSVYNMGIREW